MVGSQTAVAFPKCDFYGRISAVTSIGFELMKILKEGLNADSTNSNLHDKIINCEELDECEEGYRQKMPCNGFSHYKCWLCATLTNYIAETN